MLDDPYVGAAGPGATRPAGQDFIFYQSRGRAPGRAAAPADATQAILAEDAWIFINTYGYIWEIP